jgi:hypothetical protein
MVLDARGSLEISKELKIELLLAVIVLRLPWTDCVVFGQPLIKSALIERS